MYLIDKDFLNSNFISYKDVDYFFLLRDENNKKKFDLYIKEYIDKKKSDVLKKIKFRFILILYYRSKNIYKIVFESKSFTTIYYSIIDQKLYISERLDDFDKYRDKSLKNISKYLRFGYVPEEYTILDDVYRVRPLSVLIWDEKKCIQKEFYNIKPFKKKDFESSKRILKDLLIEDISETFKDKVPFLMYSGGIDSTVLYHIFKECGIKPFTFSISFSDKKYDESEFRKCIDLKNNFNFKLTEKQYFDYINKVINSNKKGVLRCTQDVWAFSCALENSDVKNKDIIFGLGADEFFYGYDYAIKALLIKENMHYLNECKKDSIPAGISEIVYKEYNDFIKDFRYITPEYFTDEHCKRITGYFPDLKLNMSESKDQFYKDLIEYQFKEQLSNNHYLRLRTIEELTQNNVYVPFGNINIYELALSLFPECVFYKNKKKYILYELFKEEISENNYKREKKGFSIPIKNWMENNFKLIDKYIDSIDLPFKKVLNDNKEDALYYQRLWLAFSLSFFL